MLSVVLTSHIAMGSILISSGRLRGDMIPIFGWCENGHFFPGLSTPKRFVAVAIPKRVARNSQWGAVLGGWGQSSQPSEARGSGGGAPSDRKFCIFLQK